MLLVLQLITFIFLCFAYHIVTYVLLYRERNSIVHLRVQLKYLLNNIPAHVVVEGLARIFISTVLYGLFLRFVQAFQCFVH